VVAALDNITQLKRNSSYNFIMAMHMSSPEFLVFATLGTHQQPAQSTLKGNPKS